MNDSEFTDMWMTKALKAEREEMRDEANLNNHLFRRDYRMDHRNMTFSDVQVAAITSPR